MNVEEFEKLNSVEKEKFYDYIYNKKYNGVNTHIEPAPETLVRLTKLETNLSNYMDKLEETQIANEKAHDKIFLLVDTINVKLDNALANKADKKEVQTLTNTVEDLKNWKLKLIGIFTAILFLVTFLKDEIINLMHK